MKIISIAPFLINANKVTKNLVAYVKQIMCIGFFLGRGQYFWDDNDIIFYHKMKFKLVICILYSSV